MKKRVPKCMDYARALRDPCNVIKNDLIKNIQRIYFTLKQKWGMYCVQHFR